MTLLASLLPALFGLAGVALGAWLIQRRERIQRQLAFVERQLREFYSPLWGLRREIEVRSELRVRIQDAAAATWSELTNVPCENPAVARELDEQHSAFQRLIEYDNDAFKQDLLPGYRKMAMIFRENLWLADPDTQEFYPELMEYLELWERHLREALPGEVLVRLGHTEAKLHPFYAHLKARHDSLRESLRAGRPPSKEGDGEAQRLSTTAVGARLSATE
jgi:hypothetical protein